MTGRNARLNPSFFNLFFRRTHSGKFWLLWHLFTLKRLGISLRNASAALLTRQNVKMGIVFVCSPSPEVQKIRPTMPTSAARPTPLLAARGGPKRAVGNAGRKSGGWRKRPAAAASRDKDVEFGVVPHRSDTFGDKVKGFVTENIVVRGPLSFLVERVLAPLYPETVCGDGRYVDPVTQSCVFICREGYVSVGLFCTKKNRKLSSPFFSLTLEGDLFLLLRGAPLSS